MPLAVNDLSKRYGSKWVLRSISFEVPDGTVLGVTGSKGSGKTTLLRLIAGLDKPDGGTIDAGITAPGRSNLSDGIAFVPTLPASPFFQRTFGNVSNTVDAAERQSAAVDTALNGNDQVILLDDVFAFFDPEKKRTEMDRIKLLAVEKGRVVLYASSNYEDILEFADEAIAVVNGDVGQSGAPGELYESPASTAVARVTGRTNLIEARRLSSSKSQLPEFQTITGEHRLFARKSDLAALGAINRNVMLEIRPEHISISFGASFPEDNLIKAVVSNVKFLGPMTLVELNADGLKLEALVLRLVGLNIGNECMVGLPPDRIMTLKD
jgi:ABC-type sugar transport system ATPase subunit